MEPQPRQPITSRQRTQARRIRLVLQQDTPQTFVRMRASLETRLRGDKKGGGDQHPQGLLKGNEQVQKGKALLAAAT
jgi:hypothetical protein